jgi:hypothetical protein
MEKIKVPSMKTVAKMVEECNLGEWFLPFYEDHRYALDETGEPITEREVLTARKEAYNSGNWEEVEETVTE